jgi:UTP--glucose-1-phosphate uridylyltransferase
MSDSGQAAATLDEQLRQLPAATAALLAEHGFQRERFVEQARRLWHGEALTLNRVQDAVEPPAPSDIAELPAEGSAAYAALARRGSAELAAGRCALVVLAGGMATRMGGVVKALVSALPGRTFLELRLAEQRAVAERYGARPALWLMTSHATDAAIRGALARDPDGRHARVFVQGLAPRLLPDGRLYLDSGGEVSLYAPGHGDVVEALHRSGLLPGFVAAGGRTLLITNLDNLGATLDPAILGFHLEHGGPLTSEVVPRFDSDRGGLPVRISGKLCVLEELRLPLGFDATRVPAFNINSFWFDAERLLALEPEWTYFAVEKRLEQQTVVQFERLLNQVVEWLPTRFLRVPRTGAAARFLPVKDLDELARRRAEIELAARARGLLD